MKSVLISIQPKWVEKIANGQKTIEVRKTRPNIATPFKCYIYQTKKFVPVDITDGVNKYRPFLRQNQGKVIGEFVCDRIDKFKYRLTTFEETPYKGKYISKEELAKTCLSIVDINDYLNGKNGYFWHISDFAIYENPKDLKEFGNIVEDCGWFFKKSITQPPQSWCYVESLGEEYGYTHSNGTSL